MKRFLTVLSMIAILGFMYSCDDDIDLDADYKNITIVYGLLDPAADTTFIRINKAFLGGDAYANILIPDCTQYKEDLDVRIKHFQGSQQQGDDIIFEKLNRYIYYSTTPIFFGDNYDLQINAEGNIVTSSTDIVEAFSITKPPKAQWEPPQFLTEVNYRPGFEQEVVWDIMDNAEKYEVKILFQFWEVWSDSTKTSRIIEWFNLKREVQPGFEMEVPYSNDVFYTVVEGIVPYNDAQKESMVVKRLPHRAIYSVSAAAEDLSTYIDANQPSQSVVEYRPDYSNINNGYGIFSSRTRDTLHKYLHRDTRNNLSKIPGAKFQFLPDN